MTQNSILIVEDEAIFARALQRDLEDLGYQVVGIAMTGDEAVEKAARLHPHLVLMDVGLPGEMDGIDAAAKIRGDFDIPLIFLTAYSDDDTLRRVKITDPSGFLLKPFSRRELQICIEMALYKHTMDESSNRLRQALEDRERRLRLITDHMLDMVVEIDMNMVLQYVSPSCMTILGYVPEDIVGGSINEIVHLDDISLLMALIQLPAIQPAGGAMELRFRHADGHYIWLEVIGKTLHDDGGSPFGVVFSGRDITDRKSSRQEMEQLTEQLTQWVNDLERRNRQLALINEMGELLQSCRDFEEAYTVVGQHAEEIFWDASGAFYVRHSSLDMLETIAVWGQHSPEELAFKPQDCWAIRRMRPHIVESASDLVQCDHVYRSPKEHGWGDGVSSDDTDPSPGFYPYLCVPMAVQRDARGILHLRVAPGQSIDRWKQLAFTLAERVSLAFANLELREKLQVQAIRDPLTDLFNRRYMEQSLDREVRRVRRNQGSLGLIMVDIDHFKQFNDKFSYAAGDVLLIALGAFLQAQLGPEDIVCRYGGEEFILILPGTDLKDVCQYAERLRNKVKDLQVEHRNQPLGTITISLGVATFPEHGESSEDLLRAVDTALHQAKNAGRDRMIVAEITEREN